MYHRRSAITMVAFLAPFLLMAGITACYFLAPDFYLRYVLQETRREVQVVEIITFVSALLASILLAIAAIRLWHSLGLRCTGAALIALVGASALFFAGEETDWGGIFDPDYSPVEDGFRNIHNQDTIISAQGLGSLWIAGVFFVLPLMWRFRDRFRLPTHLAPAIAEPPVITTIALGFVWKFVKSIYRAVNDPDSDAPGLYRDFIEQFNEHKEMLIAVGLLMYGLYRVHGAFTITPPSGPSTEHAA